MYRIIIYNYGNTNTRRNSKIYKEETEYQTVQDKFEEDYPEIVILGNEDDKDDYEI